MLTFKTIVLPVILQCCENLPHTLREEHRLQVLAQKEEFKCGGNRPCGRPRSRWEDNNELDLKNSIGRRELDSSDSGQGKWKTLENTVITLLDP